MPNNFLLNKTSDFSTFNNLMLIDDEVSNYKIFYDNASKKITQSRIKKFIDILR